MNVLAIAFLISSSLFEPVSADSLQSNLLSGGLPKLNSTYDIIVRNIIFLEPAKQEESKKDDGKDAQKQEESKKDDAKDAEKQEESKKDDAKDAGKQEESKKDDAKDAGKQEESKKDDGKDAGKQEESKKDDGKDAQKQDESKKDDSKDAQKQDESKPEPKKEESKSEPKKDESKPEPKKVETKPEPKKEESKPAFEVIELKAKRFTSVEELSATVIPKNCYPVSLDITEWQTPFRVISAKKHGDKVEKGDRLVELDLESYDRALNDLRREKKMADITFARAQAAIENQRQLNELDQLELNQTISRSKDDFKYFWDVEWPAKLQSLELQAQVDKRALEAEEEEMKQLEKMYKADDLVEHEEEFLLKRQRLSLDIAQFNYKRSVDRYNRNKNITYPNTEMDNKQKYQRLEANWKAALAVSATVLKSAELDFEGQKVSLERLTIKLERMEKQREILECKAPESGRFYFGSFENNKYANFDAFSGLLKANGALPIKKVFGVIVPEDTELQLSIAIPEKIWGDMENGLKGWFVANAYPRNELSVSLKSFTEFPLTENEYQGIAIVKDDIPSAMRFIPGMKGKVKFVIADKQKAIMIPESALGREGATSQRYVYVLKNNVPSKRDVKTGYSSNNQIEITDGLESGEKLIKDWRKAEE